MERIAVSAPGRVEVTGRWFGVRGRRFVRPALIIGAAGRTETRALAELDHKPWAAQDGDVWVASFPVEIDLDEVSDIELSVAPDIAVTLRRSGETPAQPGDVRTAGGPSGSPVAKSTPQLRRRTRAQDLDRLTARLAAADRTAERERERRSSIDEALEEQRTENRRLRTELGQVRAELDLARAAQSEVAAAAAELEAARQALAQERAEAGRLRTRLARAEGSAPTPPGSPSAESEPVRPARGRTKEASVDPSRSSSSGSEPDGPDDRPGERDGEPRVIMPAGLDLVSRSAPPPVRPHRPVNPSLRHRTYWLGRAVALLVLLIVIGAVYLVIHSTVKP